MTSRSVAQREGFHFLLTIWMTRRDSTLGTAVARAASGVLSASGEVLPVTDSAGNTYYYPRSLPGDTQWASVFGMTSPSMSFSLPWWSDSSSPVDAEWTDAIAEFSLIDETSAGEACAPWEDRTVILRAPLRSVSWGDDFQDISFQIEQDAIEDSGDWFPPGAEMSVARFPDIANTAARDRARTADGQLPALVFAPVGASIRVPILRVSDEVDADGTDALVPCRYLLSYQQPTNTTAAETFVMPDPNAEASPLMSPDPTSFQAIPQTETDGLGQQYWYVDGDFVLPFGLNSVTFTNGSDTATATRQGGRVRVGWQTRHAGGDDTDWINVLSIDGSSIELGHGSTASGYQGSTSTNQEGESIPVPLERPDGLYWTPALGGIAGADGLPLSNVIDVMIRWCQMASLNVPINTGDLEAMRSRLAHLDISWFTIQRGSPWGKVNQVLSMLPIRPHLRDGVVRFAWTGGYTERDIKATLTIEPGGPVVRTSPIEWVADTLYPMAIVRSRWDHWKQRCLDVMTYDGSLNAFPVDGIGALAGLQTITHPRLQAAWSQWRDSQGLKVTTSAPTLPLDIDWVDSALAYGIVANSVFVESTRRLMRLDIETDATYRWLRAGDLIYLIEPGALKPMAWRIETMTLTAGGSISMALESVECAVGSLTYDTQPGYPYDVPAEADPYTMW